MGQTLRDGLVFTFYFNKESSNQILLQYSIMVVHKPKLSSLLKQEVGEDQQKTKYRTANKSPLLEVYCCENS